MRIRTKRHELMISPGKHRRSWTLQRANMVSLDDRYLLAVLHDPAT